MRRVQGPVLATSAASAVTVAITVTSTVAGRPLFVIAGNNSSRIVTGVADNQGNEWKPYVPKDGGPARATASSPTTALDAWWVENPLGAVTTITVTYSGSAGTFNKTACAWEIDADSQRVYADVVGIRNDGTASSSSATTPNATTGRRGFGGAMIYSNDGLPSANPTAGNEFSFGGATGGSFWGAVTVMDTVPGTHAAQWTTPGAATEYCALAVFFGIVPTSALHKQMPYSQKVGGAC